MQFKENGRDQVWGYCVGISTDDEENVSNVTELLEDEKCFVGLFHDSPDIGTNLVSKLSNVYSDVSQIEDNGFAGFRFGVGFNINKYTPFFPYAKNGPGTKTKLSIALETAQIISCVIKQNNRKSLEHVRKKIHDRIQSEILEIQDKVQAFCNQNDISFEGFDLSIAPFPYPIDEISICDIVEQIGQKGRSRSQQKFKFGNPGTFFIHSYLSNTIKSVAKSVKSCGFNGLMYSLLEDNTMSELYAGNDVRVSDILALSSTCGCGIDMLPMSDENSNEEICGHLVDMFSMSSLLKKPLGVRVLLAKEKPGTMTKYNHVFLSNTRLAEGKIGIHLAKLPEQKKFDKIRFKQIEK
jgi:uncharacterized protein (UPF0210 family)